MILWKIKQFLDWLDDNDAYDDEEYSGWEDEEYDIDD